jgi:hypothetical protein
MRPRCTSLRVWARASQSCARIRSWSAERSRPIQRSDRRSRRTRRVANPAAALCAVTYRLWLAPEASFRDERKHCVASDSTGARCSDDALPRPDQDYRAPIRPGCLFALVTRALAHKPAITRPTDPDLPEHTRMLDHLPSSASPRVDGARHPAVRRKLTVAFVCLPAGRDTQHDDRSAASLSFSPSVPDRGCCSAAVAVSFNSGSGELE